MVCTYTNSTPRGSLFVDRKSSSRLRNKFYFNILNMRIDTPFVLRMEIFLLIIIQFGTNAGYVPTAVTYLFDVLNICVLVLGAKVVAKGMADHKAYLLLITGYIVLALFSGLSSGVSVPCIVWELVQQLRIPLFLILAVSYWKADDVSKAFSFLYKLQPVNFAFAVVEYFGFGLTGDQCGGLFGIAAGSNMMLNIYLVIVCSYSCSRYLVTLKERRSLAVFLLTLVCSFLIATLAEIKFFYFEAFVIVLLSLSMGKKIIRSVAVIGSFVAAFAVGMFALSVYFPNSYEMLFSIDEMKSYDDGSNVVESGYGISRVGAIGQVDNLFFWNSDIDKLVGFGFGSATMSSINVFCSPFYLKYGWLRYYYSPVAMVYLQSGYLGLVYYAVLMLYPVFSVFKSRHLLNPRSGMLVFEVCVTAMFFANCFYNASARSYAGILWALAFAAPLVAIYEIDYGQEVDR